MFKKIWLRDKSTYPIIGILISALSGATGFTLYKCITCKEIQFYKGKRQEILRSS